MPWDPLSFIDQARLERKIVRKPDLNMLMQTLPFNVYADTVECLKGDGPVIELLKGIVVKLVNDSELGESSNLGNHIKIMIL